MFYSVVVILVCVSVVISVCTSSSLSDVKKLGAYLSVVHMNIGNVVLLWCAVDCRVMVESV